MFKVYFTNSLLLSGKPCSPAFIGEFDKIEEALGLALSLHNASKVKHFVQVFENGAQKATVTLAFTPNTSENVSVR